MVGTRRFSRGRCGEAATGRTVLGHPSVVAWLPLIGLLVGCGGSDSSGPTGPSPTGSSSLNVRWEYNGQAWEASGTPPPCPTPLTFGTPVDLTRVTSILYPGQPRSGDYKPHGGFRLDGPGETGDITVVAPMATTVYRAARYLANGEVQYMFGFINACGILHRLDHLRNLSPRLQQIAASLPPAVEGDSRTTVVAAGQNVAAGETLATSVGVSSSANFFLDWGVYDLRARNEVSANPAWLAGHPGEFASYAICWFDHLSAGDAALVRSLPPADGRSGAMSDYCR